MKNKLFCLFFLRKGAFCQFFIEHEDFMNILLPAVWLIVLIAGLPQLSESIYTPSLPDIASELGVSASLVEYTLTVYLCGFAIGTLVWGKFSDRFGRKPGVLLGLSLFAIGCVGCYFSHTIAFLMASRFLQAFGGSIGSVLSQAICRDAFQGVALGKVYSIVSATLAIFPALGPLVGGLIAENAGWRVIFVFLFLFAITLFFIALHRLPETHFPQKDKPVRIFQVAGSLIRNRKVLALGMLVAGCNGIFFSYLAEGPFFLVRTLGLSPTQYGFSFMPLAAGTMLGGLFSRRLQTSHTSLEVLHYGLIVILSSTVLFSLFVILHSLFLALPLQLLILLTISLMTATLFGICMVTGNALAMALVDYKWCTGTASSLFGFFYYCLIAMFTMGMGYLHNGSLLVMPLYFLGISIAMCFIRKM